MKTKIDRTVGVKVQTRNAASASAAAAAKATTTKSTHEPHKWLATKVISK